MTSSVAPIRCWWALTRAVAIAYAFAAGASVAIVGCTSSFRPGNHLVPGPSGAVAAAPLSGHRVAILAGSPSSKGVFVVDLNSGTLQKSFGVTKEATGITAEGADGPLLITVGGITNRGRHLGSVERWTLGGRKLRVVPMPSEAHGITRVVQWTAYALVGNGSARAAVPLQVPSLRRGRPIPLDANARTLQQCIIGSAPYLLYSGSTPNMAPGAAGPIVVREVETGIVVRSNVAAESPTCVEGHQQVFALQRSFAAASVVVLSLPTLLQQGLIPASNDVIALYESDDHHLVALNSTTRLSNIEVFSDSALAMKQAPK